MAGAYRVEGHVTDLNGLAFGGIVDVLRGVSNGQGFFRSKARRSSQNAKAVVMKILFHGYPVSDEDILSCPWSRDVFNLFLRGDTRAYFLRYLSWFHEEELITVYRTDSNFSDFHPSEDAQRNVNACVTRSPDFSVEVPKSFHLFSTDGKDKIAWL